MDSFLELSEELKSKSAYRVCLVGLTGIGIAYGSVVPGLGTVAGGTVGLVSALYFCPYLEGPIKRKLFSSNTLMTDNDVFMAFKAAQLQFPHMEDTDILNILASSRILYSRQPSRFQS